MAGGGLRGGSSMGGLQLEGGQQRAVYTTPSPFSESIIAVAGATGVAPLHLSNLFLRFLSLFLSLLSALILTAPRSPHHSSSNYFQYRYSVGVCMVASFYSLTQLVKGIWDIASISILIPDAIYDCLTFPLDQLVCYLLISSSSAAMPATIDENDRGTMLGKLATASLTMSFLAFLSMAILAILSGYKLYKRYAW
ncbi:hypothetical protein AMTRI_Chr13g116800 [Amborella trichopoda]|uniref:CASP-like protein 4A4 isoform X1 n=1 Tax=Amborella trichopoda TaxID=13333 RepID=UPI0009BFDC96|nr:CASP-like protein 4A4 isoform X1 [Amborella trichopoda]|eukprot:XP_020519664.1 CASP-like protein 4A4 isoform X1 [Amborella trichopoda]